MKSMFRFGLLGFLVALAPFARGQFSVSDDFSTLSGNWFNESTTGTGAFTVTVGDTNVLSYVDGGLAASGTSTGSRDWMSNTGSYAQNWQVQIDFTFNLTQANGQMSSWSLYIGNLAESPVINDTLQGLFQLSTSGGVPSLMVIGIFTTNGSQNLSPYEPKQFFDATSSITLKATYVAATHILSLYYDADGSGAGRGFDLVTSAPVDASGLNWDMDNSDSFGFRLAAENSAGSNATAAITANQMFADNFAASSIPEPATYAAAFGILALLAAGWRRRQ